MDAGLVAGSAELDEHQRAAGTGSRDLVKSGREARASPAPRALEVVVVCDVPHLG
jgi:hypothetical protein